MNRKEISKFIFDAMSNNETEKLLPFFADEIIFDFPGIEQINGKNKAVRVLRLILRRFNFLKFSVYKIITEDKDVCVMWTNKGEYKNGDKYQNSGITYIKFDDKGKVAFLSDYFKDTSFTMRK